MSILKTRPAGARSPIRTRPTALERHATATERALDGFEQSAGSHNSDVEGALIEMRQK
jgi:hypothetical protein